MANGSAVMAFRNLVTAFLSIVALCLSSSLPSCDSSQADDLSLMQTQSRAILHQSEVNMVPQFNPSGSCRKCTSYPNVIRLGGRARTGLLDRLLDLSTWSVVANHLCARLEVRPPCEKLMHGIYGNLSRSVKWSNFIDILADDGSSMMNPPDNVSGTRVEVSKTGSFMDPVFVRYKKARAAVDSGKSFDWLEIYDLLTDLPDYATLISLTRTHRQNCRDSSVQPSNAVRSAGSAFRSKLSINSSEYVALHIRRGDAAKACNSSVSAVVQYVACSLSKNSSFDGYPIIFFTDERNPAYIANLIGNLTQAFNGSRRVYHGDAEFASISGPSSKFHGGDVFMFITEIMLRQRAGVELLMDRTHCVSCEKTPQPTQLCKGRCDFQEYVTQSQLHVTEAATDVMKQGGIKFFDPAACEQTSFPNLGHGETTIRGTPFSPEYKAAWFRAHPDQKDDE